MSKYNRNRHNQKDEEPPRKGRLKYDSRLKRIEEEQVIHDIIYEKKASSTFKRFEDSISVLFGVPGIGKSKFAACLGDELQKKYSLDSSGVYFLQCEAINHPWKIRKSILDNWPTFRQFIDDVEKDKAFLKTVKMWVIDTIDGVIPKAIGTICSDFGIADLREATTKVGMDGWYAKAWQELRDELLYQVLRLASFGPGILILSHERYRNVIVRHMTVEKASMDVSNSIYNAIGDCASIILRMRNKEDKKSRKAERCLTCLPSDDENVKDNLGMILSEYPDGVIEFKTEKQAVRKIMSCFKE